MSTPEVRKSEKFSRLLTTLKAETGLKNEQIAQRLGVARTYLSAVASGRSNPSDHLLHRLEVLRTTRHRDAPSVTIDPAVMERLQELAEAAGYGNPSAFLAALLESHGVAYVAEIKERQNARRQVTANREERRVEAAERLAKAQGEHHLEAIQESQKGKKRP